MKIRVSLRDGVQHLRNVEVEADATATVADVAGALASGLQSAPPPAGLTLRVADPVTGVARSLPPQATLVESRVESGGIVEVISAAGVPAPLSNAAVLRVVSGVDKGVEVLLPRGVTTVGRGEDRGVRLQDHRVSKKHLSVIVGSRIEVLDTNSSNGVFVGDVQVTRSHVAPGEVVRIGETSFTVTPTQVAAADPSSTDVAFNRSPRVVVRPKGRSRETPDLPQGRQRGRFPWLALVAPLVMGAAMYAFTRSVLSILFVALSPLLMIGTWLTSRLDARREAREAMAVFDAGLAEATQDVSRWQDEDRAQLIELYPSLGTCIDAIRLRGPLLWTRRPEHPEFLHVRLGLGTVPALSVLEMPNRVGLPAPAARAKAAVAAAAFMTGAPVVVDLTEVGGMGVAGHPQVTSGVLGSLILQAAALHSPAELVLLCLTSTSRQGRWSWLEWLPHVTSPHSPLGVPHLSAESGSGRILVDALEGLVEARTTRHRARGPRDEREERPEPVVPALLVIVDDTGVDRARLTRLAELGPDAGVHFLWAGDTLADLPAACRSFLDVSDPQLPVVGQVRREEIVSPVALESVDADTLNAVARLIAPVVDAGTPLDDDSDLPSDVSVISLLGRDVADDADALLGRWRENRSLVNRGGTAERLERKSGLRAIVGHAGTEPFSLDLRTQGPHALVGGTTGAGKSEFLQAWVLGLAHAYSPDRVTFLFVDYKGGSAFAHCLDLPHTVGNVTDLTPYLVTRALKSLRAELKHREALLHAKGKKDLIDLELTGDPDCPPSLIIIVDEFAALVGEVPEFVDGVVDVAQRGRSLGLHLILATQRPAGVIRDNLRANTNLRIALRMADEDDSRDVVGDPLAAHFPSSRPGRAVAKTGPGRLTPFQSGYPGARTPAVPPTPPMQVADISFGRGTAWKLPERAVAGSELEIDAVRVVRTIAEAARRGGVPAPRKPWLPSLPEVVDLVTLDQRRDSDIVLGVVDDPDSQAQRTVFFHPDANGNILFTGASGSGKSTALRSLAVASSITPDSGPVHLYGLDFAGGGLSPLKPLPNVGAIISGDDIERVDRLMQHLASLVEARAAAFSKVSASTLVEYRAIAAKPQEPRVIVLLDGYAAFRKDFEDRRGGQVTYNAFQRLIVDGRAVGVHFAMTADRPLAVPPAVLAAFSRRIVLRLADEDAYLTMGVPKNVLTTTSNPGRAVEAGKGLEIQLAILGTSMAMAAQSREIEKLAGSVTGHHTSRPAPIRRLPELVEAADVPRVVGGRPVLGISDRTLAPLPFEASGTVLVTGPSRSGRTNAMRWLVRSISSAVPTASFHLLSPTRSRLVRDHRWAQTIQDTDDVLAALPVLIERGRADASAGVRSVVFLEGLHDLAGTADGQLAELIKAHRRSGQVLVVEAESTGLSYGPVLEALKAARAALLLQPGADDGDRLARTQLPMLPGTKMPPGRGYWVKGGSAEVVQVPWVD